MADRPGYTSHDFYPGLAMNIRFFALPALVLAFLSSAAVAQTAQPYPAPYLAKPDHAVVLHAARLLDVAGGKIVTPGEILVQGDKIAAAGASVPHPAGARSEERRVGKECVP